MKHITLKNLRDFFLAPAALLFVLVNLLCSLGLPSLESKALTNLVIYQDLVRRTEAKTEEMIPDDRVLFDKLHSGVNSLLYRYLVTYADGWVPVAMFAEMYSISRSAWDGRFVADYLACKYEVTCHFSVID